MGSSALAWKRAGDNRIEGSREKSPRRARLAVLKGGFERRFRGFREALQTLQMLGLRHGGPFQIGLPQGRSEGREQ